jgi:pimeloyl-ACP methyl ester carboxylesterase
MTRIPSSEGVEVAVHELGGRGDRPTLLISHATGFHAHCYTPLAAKLTDRFHCVGLDFRGHGDTDVDPEWSVDWQRFGDDAEVVARHLAPTGGLVGFGHSMGGAALLMAAHRDPARFERLVLFEPISHQASSPSMTEAEIRRLPIVTGALRRRRRFASFDEAYTNFRSKPPLALMVDDALHQYVDHGFRRVPAADGSDRIELELRCPPELEAAIFVTGVGNGVWDLLPEIPTPTLVLGGRVEERQPSSQSEAIAGHLAAGTYVGLDDQTHFGPFSHPDETAQLIADFVGDGSVRCSPG